MNHYLKEIMFQGMNWIQLIQDSVQWRALVNPLMKLLVP
jgi:hypothetical protein